MEKTKEIATHSEMKLNLVRLSIVFALVLSLHSCREAREGTAWNSRETMEVEGQSGFLVTDEPEPRLSWKPVAEISGEAISGYEVIVADQKSMISHGKGYLWESGFLPLGNGPWVLFDASDLPSRTEIWWRVRPIFAGGDAGAWSETAYFEIGLKNADDWKGKWIGMNPEKRKRSAPQFRKSFNVEKKVDKARLYVCGLGYHESWINGQRLGNEVLQPAQTDYEIRSFYIVHDASRYIKKGNNSLGVWLGDGFYNQDSAFRKNLLSYGDPRLMAQLEITYTDGSKSIFSSDESWICNRSAISTSNIFAGENYDARIYQADWATSEANSEYWEAAEVVPSPGGKLIAQSLPPCRRSGKVSVKDIDQLRPGTWIFDFGQNLVGWARLKADALPGTEISIRFAENRLESGELGFASGGIRATKVIQADTYICKGEGVEVWEPRFTYHGFRFAEVSISNGALHSGTPGKEFLEGIVIHTDMDITGEFECSDPTLNKAFQLAHWTQAGNIQGVPTDCPIRERCGWTGDAHLTVPFSMMRFNSTSMWRKYIGDIVTKSQVTGRMLCFGDELKERTVQIKEVGIPTMVAPGKRFIGEGSPDWGCAIAFIPWDIYVRTGDIRSLESHYSSIKQWSEHLKRLSVDGIIYSGMGDWCRPEYDTELSGRELYGSVSPMLSTACYYRSVRITADAARLLGKKEDFEYFDALAGEIREAFTTAFYGDGPVMTPDQTINAIAVNWNVLAPDFQEEVAGLLAEQVKEADYHFTTGVFGMPSLWSVLGKFGYDQTAWYAIQNESAPSLKYLYKRGATTFWEVWPMERDEGEEYGQSMSHPFQGSFVAWFFEGLAGIQPDAGLPGYRLIHLEPQVFDGLDWVKCRYRSPMGNIESSWEKKGKEFIWRVEIPPGAEAHLILPGELVRVERARAGEGSWEAMPDKKQLTLPTGIYNIETVL